MSTLAQLRTRVRYNLNEDTAVFWSDDLINDKLNEAYRFYYNFILQAFEGYFNTTAYISLDGNSDGKYALPTNCANPNKIRLVSRNLNSGQQIVPLRYFERFDNMVNSQISNSTFNLPTYRFRGNYLILEPAPDFSETNAITIEYAKALTNLSAIVDVDSEFPALGEDAMVLRATIKCKGIEEMVQGGGVDADPFIKDLLSVEQLLKESLEQRTSARVYVEQFGEDDNNSMQRWY